MSASAVARNYAATLFELARRDGSEAEYGTLIEEIGGLYANAPAFRRFLEVPAVAPSEKKEAIRDALSGRAPAPFVRFLLVVLDRRRQRVLPGIARAYRDLLDERAGRVRAAVTLPFEADAGVQAEVVSALERRFDREIDAEFRADPNILGGVIIRVGDELLDASLRRQLERMRRELH
ncbi:ATP synthase F1 subunit delta [Candidatus Palauibacter sp.]|uniref:ATP synthase F1 subunit delta n=1 Tax=Candidatus Palauibacter sp. TaxID=3101350 RepID=UPI003AF1E9AC